MKEAANDHVAHVRATIRECRAISCSACPCGQKDNRVVWRGDEIARCYPIRKTPCPAPRPS